jgi:hypothetical protein
MHKKQQFPFSAYQNYPQKKGLFPILRNVFKNQAMIGGFLSLYLSGMMNATAPAAAR